MKSLSCIVSSPKRNILSSSATLVFVKVVTAVPFFSSRNPLSLSFVFLSPSKKKFSLFGTHFSFFKAFKKANNLKKKRKRKSQPNEPQEFLVLLLQEPQEKQQHKGTHVLPFFSPSFSLGGSIHFFLLLLCFSFEGKNKSE